MQIRPIREDEIGAVAELFRSLSEQFIVNGVAPEDAASFIRENNEEALRRFIAAGTHVYHVADIDGALAGFIAVRNTTHIFHMFVAQAHHGKGIARKLWEVARAASGNTGPFTVNASTYALPVYEAFGFVPTMPLQTTNGISYTPMALLVGAA
jgi:GNAT superfamily N-acetyltransferase